MRRWTDRQTLSGLITHTHSLSLSLAHTHFHSPAKSTRLNFEIKLTSPPSRAMRLCSTKIFKNGKKLSNEDTMNIVGIREEPPCTHVLPLLHLED